MAQFLFGCIAGAAVMAAIGHEIERPVAPTHTTLPRPAWGAEPGALPAGDRIPPTKLPTRPNWDER